MKFKEKIKQRFDFYKDLIIERNDIKNLYNSFDQRTKKEFQAILRFNLARTLKPYTLFKKENENFDFYNPKNNAFLFKNYIFKSLRIKNSTNEKKNSESIQDPQVMIKEIFITQVYEDEEVKIKAEDIILDCGANIGIFSVYAAKKAKMVYAFEPSQDEIASLYENQKINNCNNIKIIPKAVLDISKKAKLNLAGTTSHFLAEESNKNREAVSINTIPIDDFVREENLVKVNFIKMDIEGSEEKALLGAEETLKKFKPKLAIALYHKFSDFYKIPLLIRKLNPVYKIKVRSKEGISMLYAV